MIAFGVDKLHGISVPCHCAYPSALYHLLSPCEYICIIIYFILSQSTIHNHLVLINAFPVITVVKLLLQPNTLQLALTQNYTRLSTIPRTDASSRVKLGYWAMEAEEQSNTSWSIDSGGRPILHHFYPHKSVVLVFWGRFSSPGTRPQHCFHSCLLGHVLYHYLHIRIYHYHENLVHTKGGHTFDSVWANAHTL